MKFVLFDVFLWVFLVLGCEGVVDLNGDYELFGSEHIEYVFQKPQSSSSQQINGVIFLAHGCSHSATDWWPKSELCSKCIGLPIEISIVKEALKRNYFVISMSSTDRNHKCWNHHDMTPAIHLINRIYTTQLNNNFTINGSRLDCITI